jgi:hypothetical protein
MTVAIEISKYKLDFVGVQEVKRDKGDTEVADEYAGVGQNNGNTGGTVHISSLIWCWAIFVFNRVAGLLGMDSHKV